MKKVSIATVLVVSAVFVITPCFATPMADISLSMNRVAEYARPFTNGGGSMRNNYFRAARDSGSDVLRVAALGNEADAIDTPLEIAMLASSVGVINIAPVEAGALGTPKQTDLQLGALLMTEIAVLDFLGNRDAVGIREGILHHVIIARGNVTRQEIEAYYRSVNGVRALVSEIVDEEIAKGVWTPINNVFIPDAKQVIANFFLNPNMDSFNAMVQAMNRYGSTDGTRGINTRHTITSAINRFSTPLADATLDPARLGYIRQSGDVAFGVGGGDF